MDCNDRFIFTLVRVGVALGRLAVGCPTSVSNSAIPFQRFSAVRLFRQRQKPTFGFDDLRFPRPVTHGKPRGIVTAVF